MFMVVEKRNLMRDKQPLGMPQRITERQGMHTYRLQMILISRFDEIVNAILCLSLHQFHASKAYTLKKFNYFRHNRSFLFSSLSD